MAHINVPGDPQPQVPRTYLDRPWIRSFENAIENFSCPACLQYGPDRVLHIGWLTETLTCKCGAIQGVIIAVSAVPHQNPRRR